MPKILKLYSQKKQQPKDNDFLRISNLIRPLVEVADIKIDGTLDGWYAKFGILRIQWFFSLSIFGQYEF